MEVNRSRKSEVKEDNASSKLTSLIILKARTIIQIEEIDLMSIQVAISSPVLLSHAPIRSRRNNVIGTNLMKTLQTRSRR